MVLIFLFSVFITGCGEDETETSSASDAGVTKISLQLDWLPEAAHGGFYQALAKGYYAEEGLEVMIIPGGPSSEPVREVALGNVTFGITRLDDIILAIHRGLPLQAIGTYHQHDPQGLMVHENDPAQSFADLNGRAVMIIPQSAFQLWIENTYGIKLNIIPMDYGVQRFILDKKFVQQCFITSQPFYLEQAGVEVRVFDPSESGFDPGRIIYTSRSFAKANPEALEAFLSASLKGWIEYIYGERSEADSLILSENPNTFPALNEFSVLKMRALHTLEGRPELSLGPGVLAPAKVDAIEEILLKLGLIDSRLSSGQIVPYDLLPKYIKSADFLPPYLTIKNKVE